MPFSVFLGRFLRHVALAFAAWVGLALGVERLIPGFISPFVDLPQTLLFALVIVAIVGAFAPGKGSAWSRWFGIVVACFSAAVAGSFLWTRLAGGGASAALLMVAAVVFGGLSVLALFTREDS